MDVGDGVGGGGAVVVVMCKMDDNLQVYIFLTIVMLMTFMAPSSRY